MSLLRHAYDILGLTPDATPQEVRQAYRQLVRVWHPDRFEGDTRLQERAQEKLKEIIEAHAIVLEDLASRAQRTETSAGATLPVNAQTSSEPVPAPKPSREINPQKIPAAWPTLPSAPLLPFFSAWQNLIFLIFVVAALNQAAVRYGTMYAGAGYALKMLALPLFFAMLCNLTRFAALRPLWGTYVAVVSLFGMLLMVDAITFSNTLHDAMPYRTASPMENGAGVGDYAGGFPAASPPEPLTGSEGRASGGPNAPIPPQVRAPDAPLAPAAPIVPAAPVAPPAH